MRNGLTKLTISLAALMAVILITAPSAAAPKQQPGLTPALERREAEMARQRDMRQTEILRQRLGKRPVRATSPVYVQALIAQVQQDFERIQVARNELVRAVSQTDALDYRIVSEKAGEIKRRASRLKDNLALPDPEKDEKSQKNGVALNEGEIRAALSTLCHHIESFVKSPFFETPGVIDVQHSAAASRDLERMLELSGSIRKNIEKLNKTSK